MPISKIRTNSIQDGAITEEKIAQGAAFSNSFHGLRRTQDGKLYYTFRDKAIGTFSNDGGTTLLTSDEPYVTAVERYFDSDQTFTGDGSTTEFTLDANYDSDMANRLAVFVNRSRETAEEDYTVAGNTLTFDRAPFNNAEIFVRKIKKEYKNNASDTYQQYKFESGRNYYKLDSDGGLLRLENQEVVTNVLFGPTSVTDSDFDNYVDSDLVNSTTYSV